MRPLALYVRSRGVPATAAAVIACTVALWLLGWAIDEPLGRSLVALLVTLAATTALGPGLVGSDVDLDRVSAIAWPPRRIIHVVLGGATVAGLLAATDLVGVQLAPFGLIARNAAGFAGLVALGAAVLGAARAAAVPVLWTVLVLKYAAPLGAPPTTPLSKVAATWMVQPVESSAATVTAIALAVIGTLTYAALGGRR